MDEKPNFKVVELEGGTTELKIPDLPIDRLGEEDLRGFWLSLQRKGFTPNMARMTSGTAGESVAQAIYDAAAHVLGSDTPFVKGDPVETQATLEHAPQ